MACSVACKWLVIWTLVRRLVHTTPPHGTSGSTFDFKFRPQGNIFGPVFMNVRSRCHVTDVGFVWFVWCRLCGRTKGATSARELFASYTILSVGTDLDTMVRQLHRRMPLCSPLEFPFACPRVETSADDPNRYLIIEVAFFHICYFLRTTSVVCLCGGCACGEVL